MKKKIITTTIITGLTALVGLGAILGTKTAVKESKALSINENNESISLTGSDLYNTEYWTGFYQYYLTENNITPPTTTTLVASYISTSGYVKDNTTYSVNYLTIDYATSSTNPTITFWLTHSATQSGSNNYRIRGRIYNYSTSSAYMVWNFWSTNSNTDSSTSVYGQGLVLYSSNNSLYNYFYSILPQQEEGEGEGEGDNNNPIIADSYSFTFAYQINYYALYNANIENLFINDSTFTANSLPKYKVLFEGLTFTSGGQDFDTIRLWYQNAQALSYKDSTKTRQVWTAEGFASYIYMEYMNTETNKIEVVNSRLTSEYQSGNTTGIDQERGSIWVSSPYQTITFIEPLSEEQITQLARLNNANLYGNTYSPNNDIGVGGAFSLLGQAFTSWTGILSIQILPNISLGLLIFLPLIVGIIILIVWIVKR